MVSILADLADSARGGARVLRLPRRHPAFGEGRSPPMISALAALACASLDALILHGRFRAAVFSPKTQGKGNEKRRP
jgi:hypothetical protein